MTLLQESIGPAGFQSVYVEYFPSLSILDVEEILERIGTEWKNPGPSERHDPTLMDTILGGWVSFCDNALTGHQIAQDTIKKGVVRIDLETIDSYILFADVMGHAEKYPEVISSIRGAFWDLLSPKAKKEFGIRKSKAKVDEKLRDKIRRLISGMDVQAGFFASSLSRQSSELDD